jgi:hypothetical protein
MNCCNQDCRQGRDCHIHSASLKEHKAPNASLKVQSPKMNLWERPVYVPNNDYVRPGADDHQRIKSKGF